MEGIPRFRGRLVRPAVLVAIVLALAVGLSTAGLAVASSTAPKGSMMMKKGRHITNADRKAAAKRLKALRAQNPTGSLGALGLRSMATTMNPLGTPDYFGTVPNYANSPLPTVDASGNVMPGTGIRKFVDSLPGLGFANRNDLGQYIPVATPDTTSFPGSDYYVIALVEYKEQLHKDLPPTTLRGYVQLSSAGATLTPPSYLGPSIVAQKDRPVRVKFINKLATGSGGNLFLPVDETIMGAGEGPQGGKYSQNRATLHLHGGVTPWISDGTPHQWTTPAGENTTYPVGVSVKNVPDMWYNASGQVVATGTAGASNSAGPGTLTFYYTNQQSARLMFYHDHSYGLTRLNVYAGEAAPYVLRDPVEQALINGGSFKANGATVTVAAGTIPSDEIPLVIQDKTFVPSPGQLASEDPTWDTARFGGMGNLWFPHVYMPNQNPFDVSGANGMGRWDYGPWFWPPYTGLTHGPVANPLFGVLAGEPPQNPGTPNPSIVPEAFMDTPVINGTAYPFVKVGRKAYRFRILNASNDRSLNLQLYYAKSNTIDSVDASGMPTLQTASGDVSMTPAVPHPGDAAWPSTWPTDGRDGGVPDPSAVGPSFIQIGTEGGFLPTATVISPQPINYEYMRRSITVLNISDKSLLLGPAERADVIVDFSQVPDGAKLILYNDAPAPVPAFDTRYDYYTGDPDQTDTGGAPSTLPGYGPNTRTLMQFQVGGTASAPFDKAALDSALPKAYAATQPKPIVPQAEYGSAFATSFPDNNYVRIQDTKMSFTPAGASKAVTLGLEPKAIQELFDPDWGRMNATLGVELPNTSATIQTTIPYFFIDPPTETIKNSVESAQIGSLSDGTQIWKITHNGVDTHAIHTHLFLMQLVNRVGWDGAIKPPDPNELGWKDTVRMNPLEDAIVAVRPIAPKLPFKLGDSIRLLDPTRPAGSTMGFTNVDPSGNPVTVTNQLTNFGWEYVWHCHLLGHEENDMMRPIVFEVSPAMPTNMTVTNGTLSTNPPSVFVRWTNAATNPAATMFTVQRSTNAQFTSSVVTFTVNLSPGYLVDNTVAAHRTYYYRVRAENAAAYSEWTTAKSVTTTGQLPLPVTSLRVSKVTQGSISVVWSLPSGGAAASGIKVQYSANGGKTWSSAVTLAANATGYTINGLTRNTSYQVRVQTYNADGSSSATVTGTTSP